MKCESCKINVGQEFTFAIKNNQCPACGKNIMLSEKLASFLSLQNLLRNNFNDLFDVEKAASLIMANFELKQIFKEELPKEAPQLNKVEEKSDNTNGDDNDISDEEYKAKQIEEGKKILRNMRDEVLNEAIADQWGLGNANGITDISDVREMADLEKKKQIQENILTGSRGSFRRT